MLAESLSLKDYQAFAQFLQQECGIVLAENKQYLVRSRLGPLMTEHHATIGDLINDVMRSGNRDLKNQVINAMTTNETLWFRDHYPFYLLKNQILPELLGTNGSLRIWSSACSTGQEPYSIAMILQEFKHSLASRRWFNAEILATDISSEVIEHAQRGEYDALAMARGLTEGQQQQYFDEIGQGQMRVKSEIRQAVRFRQFNLLDSYAMLGKFDVIFCRNVLIYFSPESKRKILQQFASALNPRGFLLLGASESLANSNDDFELVRYPKGMLYRKR